MKPEDYRFEVRPLPEEDGGGWLVVYPDLPGCMSDGDTKEEALANGLDAAAAWLATNRAMGRPDPDPGGKPGGRRFALRLPGSLYVRLRARAEQEGVSANTLITAMLAEGLGRREGAKGA
jgi:antitoxin HicB